MDYAGWGVRGHGSEDRQGAFQIRFCCRNAHDGQVPDMLNGDTPDPEWALRWLEYDRCGPEAKDDLLRVGDTRAVTQDQAQRLVAPVVQLGEDREILQARFAKQPPERAAQGQGQG